MAFTSIFLLLPFVFLLLCGDQFVSTHRLESDHPGNDFSVRAKRQKDPSTQRSGSGNGNAQQPNYPGGGYPYPPPNYNYPQNYYPQYNPMPMFNQFGLPPTGGNFNFNIQPPAPQTAGSPNINNVIYGPSPPSNVNNNFYGPTLPAPAPPPPEKKEKFCNANSEFNCYNGNCLTNPHQICDGKNDCGNRVDEMNCNHLNYQIRLRSDNDEADTHDQYGNRFSSSSSQMARHEGIIEVSVKGQRGCVCNRNFDIHDADVACRELGFRLGCDKLNRVSRTKASELYSDGVPYLMDNVNCIGNETKMSECDFDGWGRAHRSCGRRNIVSITCKSDQPPALPPATASRFNFYDDIEVNRFLPNPPQPVNRFDLHDPTPATTEAPPAPLITTVPPTGLNVFTRNTTSRDETHETVFEKGEINCPGNQFSCKSNKKCIPIDRICDRYSDCEDNSDETFEGCNQPVMIRLNEGQNANEGRLELRWHGIWGTVCNKSFGRNEAGVFCRALGFHGQANILKNSTIKEATGPILLDNLACPNDDTCCLTSCHNLYFGRSTCSHAQDVVMQCSNLLQLN